MSTAEPPANDPSLSAPRPVSKPPRFWPALVLVAAYWALVSIFRDEASISATFLSSAGALLALTLAFIVWWLVNRRVTWHAKLWPLVATVAGAFAAIGLSREKVDPVSGLFTGLPLVFTVWALWLLAARRLTERARTLGLIIAISIVWGGFCLIRLEGLSGDLQASVHWRWTPTAEVIYLASRPSNAKLPEANAVDPAESVSAQPGDWLEFRGPDRLGEQREAEISTNWHQSPPKLLWKRRIGPAWSSIVVVGQRLFTQEQRGAQETVVCLDAATGHEIWAHQDTARFWDGQAGAGPRGTPTFDGGRLYCFGATGILNCLDAASGKLIWTRNVAAETKAPLPMWGFSSSPLVAGGFVMVYAGGPDGKGLVAYRADSGEPAWAAATGQFSYSSAQAITLEGESQVLILSDTGLVAVDATTGAARWQIGADGHGVWRVVQPRQLDEHKIVIGSEDLGLVLLQVTRDGHLWTATQLWASKAMRPAYNDFVVVGRDAFGFDGSLMCCVDLETGKRRWKAGRYGHGQVLLLFKQQLLLVLCEQGEVVLVAADPREHRELARFQAVAGKTWNHPVVAHGRLYVRNDNEIAAYSVEAGAP